jgi:hypothetical protein
MNIRDLMSKLDTIAEAEATANPWIPKPDTSKQDAWAKLSPAQQKWLGQADPTDPYILARMRSAVPDEPAPTPTDPATIAAAQTAADAATANTAKEKLARLNALIAKLGTAPIKESMANQLVESFGYQTNEGIGSAVAGRAAKLLPGVGLAYGAYDAIDRAKEGDWLGAGMAGASGIASLVPGVGTAVSAGLDAANLARDYKGGKFGGDTAMAAKTGTTTDKGDPKVAALQQKLVSKGAKIAVDGIMGPQTQAAMKQFNVQQSVAEGIAALRDRLAMMETEAVTDEGAVSTAWNAAKNLGKNFMGGTKGLNVAGQQAAAGATNAAGKKIGGQVMKATGAERLANKAGKGVASVGQAAKANPLKAALGGAAIGGAAGLAMGGAGAAASPTGTTTGGNGGKTSSSTTTTTTTGTATTQDMEEINNLMSELSQFEDPAVQQGLVAARAALAKATGDKNIGSADAAPDARTPAEVQASADLNKAGL